MDQAIPDDPYQRGSVGTWAILRGELSAPTLLVATTVTVITILGMNEVLRDPFDSSGWAFVALASPAATGAWMAIEQLWRPSPMAPLGRFMTRQLVFGLVFAVVNAVVHVFSGRDAAEYGVIHHPDYRYPTAGDQLTQGILAFDLLGYAASIGGGTAALILVLIPYWATRDTRTFAEANALSPSDEDLPAARTAGLAMSILLVLVFAVPTLIVVGNEVDNPTVRWIGILLAPFIVVLTIVVKLVQRPDRSMSWLRRSQWWRH